MRWTTDENKERIYGQLLKEMKYWFPEIPASSDQLDPVIRLLLGTFAHQIEKLNQKINATWDKTFLSLVRSVFAEGLRWPVPASTVMKADPTDQILELDPTVRFLYRDEKEERNLVFAPLGRTKLLNAQLASAYYLTERGLIQLIPGGDQAVGEDRERASASADAVAMPPRSSPRRRLYLGIRYHGSSADFLNVPLFVHTDEEANHQIRWSQWCLSSADGHFLEDGSFCPGVDSRQRPESPDPGRETFTFLGGVFDGADLFRSLTDRFFHLPPTRLARWGKCRIPYDLQRFIPAASLQEQGLEAEELFWIRIDLPERAEKTSLFGLQEVYFNCFVAVNKNDLTSFRYTAGNQLLEVELPEESSTILGIDSVSDSNGREYQSRLNLSSAKAPFGYVTEEREGRLALWFDFTDYPGAVPNSVSVNYSTTVGPLGNGLEAGKIKQLWESHPGIKGVTNILPTGGGMPAKSPEELLSEISSLLRNRGRAVSFEEIQRWAKLFDSRITFAECKNVVRKGPRGAFRCTQVNVKLEPGGFYSEDELRLLGERLERFLIERSLINVSIEVNILSV
jgi:hypothetical protein